MHPTIPTPPTPSPEAYRIRRRLEAGESLSYDEVEALDDLSRHEVLDPILWDCGGCYVLATTPREILHEARWVDAEGREVSGDAVHGYCVDDYYTCDLDERMCLTDALRALRRHYLGPAPDDDDQIGLDWSGGLSGGLRPDEVA